MTIQYDLSKERALAYLRKKGEVSTTEVRSMLRRRNIMNLSAPSIAAIFKFSGAERVSPGVWKYVEAPDAK